jgi:hypothetical protein
LPFDPSETDDADVEPRSTFKRSKRKGAPAPHSSEMPLDEPPVRKKKKQLAKVTVQAPTWHAWIDPAAILWLPLPIALAFFVGSALFSQILPAVANEDGSTNINFIFLTFSLVLAFLPLAYLLAHWMQIAGTWATGNTADPPFPDFDVGAILSDFIKAIPAAAFAALCSGWVFFLRFEPAWTKSALASLLFAVYFAVGLVAVSLQSHPLASNPISILMALLRMHRGRLNFFIEASVHLLVGFLLWRAIFAVWEKNWDVGLVIWGALWIFVFFSGARLMRAVGIYYRLNAKRIGWFT